MRSRRASRSRPTTSPTSAPAASRRAARCSKTCCTRTCARSAPRLRRTRRRRRVCTSAPACASSPPKRSTRRAVFTQTDNALDVAIEGRGFFQIQMPDGTTTYTRDGSFQLSAQGQMVTSSGYVLQPGISIPDGSQSITIGRDGVVSVRVAGQPNPVQVGQLQLTDFVNPAGLAAARRKPDGGNRRQRPRADRHARTRTASARSRRVRSNPRTSTWSKSWST